MKTSKEIEHERRVRAVKDVFILIGLTVFVAGVLAAGLYTSYLEVQSRRALIKIGECRCP